MRPPASVAQAAQSTSGPVPPTHNPRHAYRRQCRTSSWRSLGTKVFAHHTGAPVAQVWAIECIPSTAHPLPKPHKHTPPCPTMPDDCHSMPALQKSGTSHSHLLPCRHCCSAVPRSTRAHYHCIPTGGDSLLRGAQATWRDARIPPAAPDFRQRRQCIV